MDKLKFIFLILFISFVFSRCSTDVDIYADYKDITLVYGLLDKSDDTIWLKITKAYQGMGDAYYYAKIPDSSNYSYKLDVTVTGIKNGSEIQTLTFDTITIHNKLPGDSIFYYPNQLMYYAVPEKPLNANAIYHLSIKRKDAGEVKSKTAIVSDFFISKPLKYINFTTNNEVVCQSANNGKRYEFTFTFYYKEFKNGSTDTLQKSVSWLAGVQQLNYQTSGYVVSQPYIGDNFYNLLLAKLEQNPNITRYAGMLEVSVACGTQDLDTYIQINSSANTLMNELPHFTNLEGGAAGLFTSRHTAYRSYELSVKTLQKLVNDYPQLGFEYIP
jgi:hypothetical protein